jgi:poly(A) polymerase
MKSLLANVPASRLFDEMIKLLQTGHSLASLAVLKKYGLDRDTFPILDAHFQGIANDPKREAFVNRALADTDRRVNEGKPVAPSFLMACIFWHEVSQRWQALRAQGEGLMPALQQAVDATFDARIGDISGRGKLAADMREIWLMQPRFDKRTGTSPAAMLAQPRFRAAFDFMRLRADAGEVDESLAQWWEDYSSGDDNRRRDLVEAARKQQQSKPREPKAAPRDPRPIKAAAPAPADAPAPAPDAERAPAPAPRVSVAKQQMLQLVAAGRAALADGASEADRDALRAVFAHPELPRGDAGADAPALTATQQLVSDAVGELQAALAGEGDGAAARALLDKVEKKANTVRRRRGGGGRKKAAGPAFQDDEDDDGDAAE